MTRDYFVFEVFSEIRLTRPELRELIECSKHHYDHTCRAASERGGILYRYLFWFDDGQGGDPLDGDPEETKAEKLSSRDLDLLVKMTELPMTPLAGKLHVQLKMLLIEAGNAYRDVNKHLVEQATG